MSNIIIAKNQTDSPILLRRCNQIVPANGQITLTDSSPVFEIQIDETLAAEILAGHIILNDGYEDWSQSQSTNFGLIVTLSNSDPADVDGLAAVVGTSATAARSDHKHGISTAAPSQGIGSGNAEGNSVALARADHDHALRETSGPTNLTIASIPDGYFLQRSGLTIVGSSYASLTANLAVLAVNAIGDITTTSTRDVVATSMTLIPGAGSYIVLFSSDVKNSASGKTVFVSTYANSIQVTNSQIEASGKERSSFALHSVVTGLGAGQAIDVKWHVDASTGTLGNRTLTLIKYA